MLASKRLDPIQSAIFFEMDTIKKERLLAGRDVIELGIGSPDLPPPIHVREALAKAALDPHGYGYPTSKGSDDFRIAVSGWYQRRFGVILNPETEVLSLMGSQDGLTHLALAIVDPGDTVLVPDPGYPIYSACIHLAGGQLVMMPLREENQYLPDLAAIPAEVAAKAKMMIINYPNNPLSAVTDRSFFEKVLSFAKAHNILVVQDLAYSELAFDGFKPSSILEIPGAKEIAVEFHSLSKSFNMAGCRIGFVVGNEEALSALATIKSNIDYGVFTAIQKAAIAALTGDQSHTSEMSRVYQRRRDILVEGLRKTGWNMEPPKATMFVWARIPTHQDSRTFCRRLLQETGVAIVPGIGFGALGEGYVRIGLVQDESRLQEAVNRIANVAWWR